MNEYPWFDFDQVDFVTADTHFSHARISELADRRFQEATGTLDRVSADDGRAQERRCAREGMRVQGRGFARAPGGADRDPRVP